MSDFQDEQELGELPADLYSQYVEQFKPSYVPVSGVSAVPPQNLSSDSPKYPVKVNSVFQTLPINAVDFLVTGGEIIDNSALPSSGIPGVVTLLYTTDSSHVDVIKKLKWNVSPRRYFLNQVTGGIPQGLLTVSVGGIVINRVSAININDSGELDLNIIAGLSTQVKVIIDFRDSYGTIAGTNYGGSFVYASFCYMSLSGFSLLSRGLPPNFEIAS